MTQKGNAMSGTDIEFLQVILKRMHEDVGELLRLHKHTARRLNRIEGHLGLTEGMPDENIYLELTPRAKQTRFGQRPTMAATISSWIGLPRYSILEACAALAMQTGP